MSATLLKLVLLVASVAALPAASAAPIPGQGTWESTLQGRDAQGRPVLASSADAVFLYDTALDVTWLRDTNAYGPLTWPAAMAMAAGLDIGGFGGWRLPAMVQPGVCDGRLQTGCIVDQAAGRDGTAWSELQYLWSVELGNPLGVSPAAANTGNFLNLEWGTAAGDSSRWLNTLARNTLPPSNNLLPWTLYLTTGTHVADFHQNDAWAVMLLRDGDVRAVPLPSTAGLAGLALVLLWARRRAPRQKNQTVRMRPSSTA